MSAFVKEAICHLRTPASFPSSGTPYSEFVVEPGNSIYKNVHGIIPIGIKIPNIFGNVSSEENRIRVVPLFEGDPSVDGVFLNTLSITTDPRWQLFSVTTICEQLTSKLLEVTGTQFETDVMFGFEPIVERVALFYNGNPQQPVIGYVDIPVTLALKLGFTPNQFTTVDNFWARFTGAPVDIIATNPPNLKGTDTVFVHLHGLTNGNLVQASDGQNYNVVQCVPMTNHNFGTYVYHEAPDVLGSRVHFDKVITFDSVRVQLTDSNLKPLLVPSNYEIEVLLKIFHSDG